MRLKVEEGKMMAALARLKMTAFPTLNSENCHLKIAQITVLDITHFKENYKSSYGDNIRGWLESTFCVLFFQSSWYQE